MREDTYETTVGGDDDADLGPLNSAAQLDRVEGFMDRLPANASVLAGGKRTGTGYHFEPTVIDGVFQTDEVVCEEIFGPVVTVQLFADEAEALELANNTKYALASSVWSNNHGVVTSSPTSWTSGPCGSTATR